MSNKLWFAISDGAPEVYVLHFNVGLYSLFSRVYGMYPWHFLMTLQDYYAKQKISPDLYRSVIEVFYTNLSTLKIWIYMVNA